MARDDEGREVVYLIRGGDSPLKYLFTGAAIGAALALLFAPADGEETRRMLGRRARKLRDLAEDGLDELEDRLTDGTHRLRDRVQDTVEDVRTQAGEVTEAVKSAGATAREELERRLADARARRRGDLVERRRRRRGNRGRGRGAGGLTEFRLGGWHRTVPGFLRRTLEKADENNVPFLASALAFDALLASIPFMLLLLVVLSVLVQGRLLESGPSLTDLFEQFLPPHAELKGRDPFALLETILRLVSDNRGALTLYTVPIFLWFSTRFFASVRTALNHIFDVSVRPLRRRGVLLTILVAKGRDVAMVVATLALFLVNTLITALFGIIRALGDDAFPDAQFFLSTLGVAVGHLLAFLFGVSLFFILYRYAAQRALGWRPALVAATFAAVAFEVAKRLYGLYLLHFATLDRFSVGFNIGAGLLFVLWAYYTALVFLVGAVVAQTWNLREMQRRQRAELR